MFDTPIDLVYVWLGLALVGIAALGVAAKFPAGPPPDATPVARTVDSVAASAHEATASRPIEAAEIRLGSERVGLRSAGGTAHAAFAYDRVVPVTRAGGLRAVLRGEPPDARFPDRDAFEDALNASETREPDWRPAPARLLVRRVAWGEVNATLVGA